MKFLRGLFGLILLLAIAAGGGYLIYVGSDQTAWSLMLVQLDSYRIFGIGCGLLTGIIRLFGSMPEGVSFSIIIMNILVPHIERWTTPKPFGTPKKVKKAKEATQ